MKNITQTQDSRLFDFFHDGNIYQAFTIAQALSVGVPQSVIDDAIKQVTIIDVKKIAGKIITEKLPEWKQRNMIARATELNEIVVDGGILDAQQASERQKLKDCWAEVGAVRWYSDQLEADIVAGNNPDINAGWPSISAP